MSNSPDPLSPSWDSSDPQQAEVYSRFLDEASAQWTTVYRSWGSDASLHGAQYSALLMSSRAESALRDPGWEVHIGSDGYGFSQSYTDGVATITYERFPGEGTELLVFYRDFHGVRPSELEICEEFRLLFNLWEDQRTRTYYYFDDVGNAVKAATIKDKEVRILTSLLRRYQAAKQVRLALYLDSTLISGELPEDRYAWQARNDHIVAHYYRDSASLDVRTFSCVIATRLLSPPPIEECALWPFERASEFEDFVIAVTADGEEIEHTSDPDELANYFGANPGSPHYLSPVYFRREVLNKYYAKPDRYTVEDGYIRCAGLWGLRLDNDQSEYVMVFLGDLGRYIPFSEAQYWRSFNVAPPEEGPSETLVRRAFLAEFADPQSADLRFARVYKDANDAWAATFGEPLFKPLHEDDRHVLSRLHVPVGEGQAEFDDQISTWQSS